MSSTTFIADSEATTQNWTETVQNTAPYPAIALVDFQKAMRLDHTIDSDRALYELRLAKTHINRQLKTEWQKKQQKENPQSNESPTPTSLDDDQLDYYTAAVYHHARAKLLEQYRDVDSTDRGDARATEMDKRIKIEWRETRVSIRALVGRSRCTIELI